MTTRAEHFGPARPTRAGRLADYVGQMFPLLQFGPFALAMFASVYLGGQALASDGPLVVHARAAFGAATALLFLLLMRVYDELKDVDHDRRLAAAGDPRYLDRPLVTGRVTLADLEALRSGLQLALVALNVVYVHTWALAGFAAAYLVTWLSSRWFFWPAVSRHLLLAFATHNPIALCLGLYALSCLVADVPQLVVGPWALALLVLVWMPFAAWETARKLRAPADETQYQTYSRILGPRVAGLAPAAFAVVGSACLIWLSRAAGIGWVLPSIHVAATAVALAASLRYVIVQSAASARVTPVYEAWSAVTGIGWVCALVAARGVAFVAG